MIAKILSRHVCRVVVCMTAGLLLAGISARGTLAQQPGGSEAGGPVHAAPSGEKKGDGVHAPQVKIAPAKERPIVHGGSNGVDRNAIGLPVARPDSGQRPAALNAGRPASLTPAAPSAGVVGLGSKGYQAPRIPAPGPRPLVVSHSTIGGAASTRPGAAALKPVGGPAKPAATGINGTDFRAKP